jgi:hypothetical protein
VTDIKAALLAEAKRKILSLDKSIVPNPEASVALLQEPDSYVMKVVGIEEYILNESLALHRVDFIQVCSKSFVTPQFEMKLRTEIPEINEESRKAKMVEELKLGTEISSLVGSEQVGNFLGFENDEVADFRRAVIQTKAEVSAKLRDKVAGDSIVSVLPEYLIGEPLPLNVPERLTITARYSTQFNWKVDCSRK